MQRRRVLTAAAAAALLLVSCSSGSEGDEKAETIRPTTTRPPSSTTTVTVAGRVIEKITQERLREALLTVEDLPVGYSVWTDEDDDQNDDEPCEGRFENVSEATVEAEASFSKGSFGPFLAHALGAFDQEATAKKAMAVVRAGLNDCQTYETTDEDGTVTTVRLTPLSFPKFGDETFALRLTAEGPFSASGDIIFMRRGPAVALVLHIALLAGADTDETVRIVENADRKLDSLV